MPQPSQSSPANSRSRRPPGQGRTVQFETRSSSNSRINSDDTSNNDYSGPTTALHHSDSADLAGLASNQIQTLLPPSFYGSSFPPAINYAVSGAPRVGNGSSTAVAASTSVGTTRNPSRPNRPNIPQRTTKITQKLVLFPDDSGGSGSGSGAAAALHPSAISTRPATDALDSSFLESVWTRPGSNMPSDVEADTPTTTVPASRTDVDSVADAARTHAERQSKEQRTGLPRGEAFKMDDAIKLCHNVHGVIPKSYDECVYFYYEPGMKGRVFGHEVISSGVVYGGKRGNSTTPSIVQRHNIRSIEQTSHLMPGIYADFPEHNQTDQRTRFPETGEGVVVYPWMNRSEVFIFDYGVVVLWNFSKTEEQQFLSMIRPFGIGLLSSEDIEIEDFHFQYDLAGPFQPRIFNDMITLKSSSPLIKLTISHGLAQSVKLALFENAMEETIDGATPLPRMMAKYGQVKMSRIEIMKIVGQLYKLKMNVNLISNVLDTPEIFWAEPELEGLYNAIRGYLEISQRAKLLNSRADVLSDLLDMLTEHLNSNEMTFITWVVIILIFFAVIIAIAEVVVKLFKMQAGLE
ncbi:hypothetical protein BSLG_002115 [Batrachochytrium salamandrivorans]|nr:hypothetical protein BSLG_002115 [Batrachochytrium salamandrivorans]